MTGFDQLAALLNRGAEQAAKGPSASADPRPSLYEGFEPDREGVEEMGAGAAIAAATERWLAEHWPALAIGAAAGLLAIAIPALILAPGLAR